MSGWEAIADASTADDRFPVDKTERLQVPGEWLYRTVLANTLADCAVIIAMVFVPEKPTRGNTALAWEERRAKSVDS